MTEPYQPLRAAPKPPKKPLSTGGMIAAGIVFVVVAAVFISIAAKQQNKDEAKAAPTTTASPDYHYTAPTTVPTTAIPTQTFAAPPPRGTTTVPHISNDELFLATLTANNITVLDNDNMVALGKAVCSDLDSGLSFTSIGLDVTRSSGGLYSLPDVGYIMGAAVSAFCPEHKADMPGR